MKLLVRNTLVLSLCLASFAVEARTIYVNQKAPPGGDGSSWERAVTTVQEANQLSQSGDQIWITAGTYTIGYLPSSAQFIGSFNGTETSIDQRNIPDNPTIFNATTLAFEDISTAIDGIIFSSSGAGFRASSQDFAVRNCTFERSGLLFRGRRLNVDSTIIREGSVGGPAIECTGADIVINNTMFDSNNFMAALIRASNSIAVSNCASFNNRILETRDNYGIPGTILLNAPRVDVTGSAFFNNTIEVRGVSGFAEGAGLNIYGQVRNASVVGCYFGQNELVCGSRGDVIFNGAGLNLDGDVFNGASFTVEGNIFEENRITIAANITTVSASHFQGAGLANMAGLNRVTLNYNHFRGNIIESRQSDGGNRVYMKGAGAAIYEGDATGNIFEDNRITGSRLYDPDGAGLYSWGGRVLSNHFVRNSIVGTRYPEFAGAGGGALFTWNAQVVSNLFESNRIDVPGASQWGGAVFVPISDRPSLIWGNTFVNNTMTDTSRGGIVNIGGESSERVVNNIFYNNSAGIYSSYDRGYADYNCMFQNGAFNFSPRVQVGPNNLFVDPQFVNPAQGNWHLRPTSPLIDAGTDAFFNPDWWFDFEFDYRWLGKAPDIGADEFNPGK